MRKVLVITSSGNDEFSKWEGGGHGKKNNDGDYIIDVHSSIITVVNGYPNNQALTVKKKAAHINKWMIRDAPASSPSEKAVVVHGQISILRNVEKACKEEKVDLLDIRRDRYSSTDRNAGLNRFVQEFYKKESGTVPIVASLVGWIWRETPEQRGSDACHLRAEILSPLVALDLIEQAVGSGKVNRGDIPKDLPEEIAKAIKYLDKPIKEFCGLSSIKCDDFKEQLQKLRMPDDYSWDKYHDELKDVAEKMETQIQGIEA